MGNYIVMHLEKNVKERETVCISISILYWNQRQYCETEANNHLQQSPCQLLLYQGSHTAVVYPNSKEMWMAW